jgi:ankyrin repeat protein
VLSRALIDEKLVGGDSALVCYFFFKDNEEQNSTPRAICALLHQLFRSKKSLFSKYAVPAIKENGEQLKTGFEELWRLLMAAATDLEGSKIICVLDALDECQQDDRDKLIRKLEEFYKASAGHSRTGPSLKFLVTSRPYRQIELRFFTLTKCVPTIRLAGEEELDAISGEINIAIKAKVQQIGEELGLSETVQSSLEKRLSEISHRTYLWLRLIWDELRNALSGTERKLLKVIDKLPTTVEEAYEMLLQKCAEKEEARKILHIIVAAYRPLTLREMDVVLEIQGQSRSYEQLDLEEEETRKAQIRYTCGLFVSIVDSKVHLIHQTAKEFLVRKNNEESKAHIWRHSLDLRESHKILSEICITHLFFDEFREHPHFSLDKILREAHPNGRRMHEFWERQENVRLVLRGCLAEHAFLDYSATYWVSHFREASIDKGHRLTDLASKLCEINRERPLLWFDMHCVLNRNSPYTCERQFIHESPFGLNMSPLWPVKLRLRSKQEKTVNQPSTLYWAARSGLTGVVQLLLHNGAKVNTQGGHYGNALQAAAADGYERVVEQLPDASANANTQGGYYGNALQAAAAGGHERVVEQLLKACTNINAQGGYYGNALQAAAASGYERVVEQLLKANADVNARGGCDDNALKAAAVGGHDKVVKQLLDAGANVNAQDGHHSNALQAAAARGYGRVVEQLLKASANVNAQGGDYGNALQAAVAKGHDKVVEQLLRANADANAQGGRYNNVLQAAAVGGHNKVIEQLLNAGANVNAQGGHYGSALQAAAASGHEKVVEQLLRVSANVNAQGGCYGNALQAAAAHGYEKVVEQLLRAGANSNTQGGHYGNALQVAAAGGYGRVIEQLLKASANVNAQGGYYGNALQAKGYDKVIEQLLRVNADVSAQGGHYGNALQAAAASGHEKVVEQLLRVSVNVNAQGGYYGNALQAAAAHGYEKVVEQLLRAGANSNTQGGHYGNALQAAAAGGYGRVIEQLLKACTNVSAQGEHYGNALQAAAASGCERGLTKIGEVPDISAQFEKLTRTLYRVYLGGKWYYFQRIPGDQFEAPRIILL